jgi:hypothetical protein
MAHATLTQLAPTIPRSAYTRWAPTAADRLDWQRRITTLNATAAHHSIDRDTAQHVLLGLMDTAEWHTRIWTLDDLFDTAHGSLLQLAAARNPMVTLMPRTARHATRNGFLDRFRHHLVITAPTPEPRTLATAWTRYVDAHPERPALRVRHAQT